MIGAFKRVASGVLTVLGEDSFLRGDVPCRVNIEHGVQVTGDDQEIVVERSIATISNSVYPKVKDILVHPDGRYRLDAIFHTNGGEGGNTRFILLPQPVEPL